MKYLAILMLLFLSGCAVRKKHVDTCAKVCEPNDGIAWLSGTVGGFECHCANGAGFSFND